MMAYVLPLGSAAMHPTTEVEDSSTSRKLVLFELWQVSLPKGGTAKGSHKQGYRHPYKGILASLYRATGIPIYGYKHPYIGLQVSLYRATGIPI